MHVLIMYVYYIVSVHLMCSEAEKVNVNLKRLTSPDESIIKIFIVYLINKKIINRKMYFKMVDIKKLIKYIKYVCPFFVSKCSHK